MTPDSNQLEGTQSPARPPEEEESFVESALKLGGKSDEEARKTGAIDRADQQVEGLFAPKYQTAGSPVHRAIWESELPLDGFMSKEPVVSPECQEMMDQCLKILGDHRRNKTDYDENGKISRTCIGDLARVGYFGALVPKEYGGAGMSMVIFSGAIARPM